MKTMRICALAAAFAVLTAGTAELTAQERPIHAGAHVSYGFEEWSSFGLGLNASYPLAEAILGAASFTYHFPGEEFTFWDFNLNAHFLFDIEGNITPYAGGGLNYSRWGFPTIDVPGFDITASGSEVGLNLVGGAFMSLENRMRLFTEGRFVISDLDQFVLSAGLSLPLGGN